MTKSLSILVADDVEEIQNVIAQWLRARGHRVECASSGEAAIRLTKSHAFDLVIADVLMPDSDGLDLMRELTTRLPATRILVISGGGRYIRAADCIKLAVGLGAHASILKPFTEAQLQDGITAALAS